MEYTEANPNFIEEIVEKVELIPLLKDRSLDIDENVSINLIDKINEELVAHLYIKQKNPSLKFSLKSAIKNPECIYFFQEKFYQKSEVSLQAICQI